MFTADAQHLIERAKDVATTWGDATLGLRAIATAVAHDGYGGRLLAECFAVETAEIHGQLAAPVTMRSYTGKMPLAQEVRELLAAARALAQRVPLTAHPEQIGVPHLAAAVAAAIPDPALRRRLPGDDRRLELLAAWVETAGRPPSLGEITRRLRLLREELRRRVFGQETAIQCFVDGLFHATVAASVEVDRRRPAGIFVFAGPPGVGKTYMAELGASHLDRPFKRFDMSWYAHGHETSGLVGTPRMYHGAQPGQLTEFVRRNPDAILLFDELERAHPSAIQLFLQLLDGGRVQDKFAEEDVDFTGTIVIFTTNVGRALYDNPNESGVHQANSAFHRATVVDALRTETDPETRKPYFPAAICSRLATGHPVLFNRLRVHELTQVARGELERVGKLLERRHGQSFTVAPEVALALVMREGEAGDARTMRAQAESFLKDELFKACQLFAEERVDAALGAVTEVAIQIDEDLGSPLARRLFATEARPNVLLVADADLAGAHAALVPEVDWHLAQTVEQALETLGRAPIDLILVDLGMRDPIRDESEPAAGMFFDVSMLAPDRTLLAFDHYPPAARRFAPGQRLLEQLHLRMGEVPIFLLAIDGPDGGHGRPLVDDELLMACVRAGGARGVIQSGISAGRDEDSGSLCADFRAQLQETAHRLRMEGIAAELARQMQVVVFDTAPLLVDDMQLVVRCRNFRTARAVRAADAAAVLADVERPTTRFADVIGGAAAKEALGFVRDWLREPRRYAAAGVEPPRGILLAGPPGTGKTMLARALAGESECAFLAEAATSFVTMWQGSGPQNVRDLFARARRYAPSVVFIDELDAVGKARVGSVGAGRAQEETLNALLSEIDGFGNATSRPVIVVAATNFAKHLDPALVRRFGQVIEVELPTRDERALYLRSWLAARSSHAVGEAMVERLAAQSAGMSLANLANVLAQASVLAFANQGIVTDAIIDEAFERVTMGAAKPGVDLERVARHEAGHALLMCLLDKPPVYVTIVGRGSFGGYAARDLADDRACLTRPDLEALLCQILGGRAAEIAVYGEGAGDSTGPEGDLETATGLALQMVQRVGMAEEVGPVHLASSEPMLGPSICHAAVRRIIEAAAARAVELVRANRATLDRIASALLEHNRLLKDELVSIVMGGDA